jgi:predicted PurR-regulated permease PerM
MLKWLAVFLTIWFIHAVRSVFPPFIVGAIMAYLLLPLVQWLVASCTLKKSQAVALIYLGVAAILAVLGWLFLPTLMDQFAQLATQRREIIQKLVVQISTSFNLNLNVNDTVALVISSLEGAVGRPAEIVHSVGLVSHWLLSLLVCIVSSIYFIVDSDRVGDFCLRFVPQERHEIVESLSGQMNVMLARYVRGQLILIVIMSMLAYVFLHFFVQMKYALAVAIMSGFLEIIPVLGPIVATTTATTIGFFSTNSPMTALTIIAFYTIARWAEDYFIVPRIIGHAVHLHPLIVIFAVLCGEVMAGALGMLIAIPVAASIKVIVDFMYPPKSKQKEVEPAENGKNQAEQPAAKPPPAVSPVAAEPASQPVGETVVLEKEKKSEA